MRQITQDMAAAFVAGVNSAKSNTAVSTENEVTTMRLHGHRIAERREDGSVWINFQGYFTTTTKERINGLMQVMGTGVYFFRRDWDAYMYNSADDSETEISTSEWIQVA